MFLKRLDLAQFRNYSQLSLSPAPTLNWIIGSNGSGKSNILEAVAVAATGQSHRGAEPKLWVQWGQTEWSLKGLFEGEHGTLLLESRQKNGRPRQIWADGQLQKRLRDWAGRVPLVSFSPDELQLVKAEPAVRRRVLDRFLSQVDGAYAEALQRYQKVLEERNAALRQVQEGAPRDILAPWDGALIREGAALSFARQTFLTALAPTLMREHRHLSDDKETLTAQYKPSLDLSAGTPDAAAPSQLARLRQLREAEMALGNTLIGPHRDDVDFFINGKSARSYASQGQQRTVALAVILAQRTYLTQRQAQKPIVLLDDVFSELDPPRRRRLTQVLDDGSQCWVTLTDKADWPHMMDEKLGSSGGQIFNVQDGPALSPAAS